MPRNPNIAVGDFVHTGYVVENHVATITLNRPEIRNALNYRARPRPISMFAAWC